MPDALVALAARLAGSTPQTPIEEMRQQNQELLGTLDQLRQRQEELSRLNVELEDTNRGVVALYAELDEKAHTLRRADDVKSRFLSNMSHEFRTPLNSMLALSRLLLDDADSPLGPEQRRQVGYIRKAAEDLSELAILSTRPDVALIDLGLPELDGYEVARRVRETAEGKRVRLVALTGYGLPEDLHREKPDSTLIW